MALLSAPDGCLPSSNRMVSAVCAADVSLPVDDAEHLWDGSWVSAHDATGFEVNTPNLSGSFGRRHSPEPCASAFVSFDWLVATCPEGAFLATGAPERREEANASQA